MSRIALVICLTGCAWSQSLTEAAGAAAAGSAGGVAGKKVSDGLTTVFNKVEKHTAKAADGAAKPKNSPASPLLEVGPGIPKDRTNAVPPPPVRRAAVHKQHGPAMPVAPTPEPPAPAAVLPEAVPVPPPPAPPEMTVEDLKKIATGTSREELLKLGTPASRITMFDDGHIAEIYRYMEKDTTLGTVRLTDGVVAGIELR